MTRARYLVDLATMAACPPPVVDALAVGDFISLILGLEDVRAAVAKQQG